MKLETLKTNNASRSTIQERGQAALVATVLLMVIMISAVFGVSAIALKEAKIAEENKKSKLSFFAAESGVEDAVYRLKRGKNLTSSFTISLNGASAPTTVTTNGGIKEIKSAGDASGVSRAIRATLFNTTGVSFHYGVQVGDDGLELGDNSMVNGNVFSNGNIDGAGSSKSRISGNAQAAGNSSIKNIRINNGASAYSFDNCVVDGQAKYVSGFTNCTASSTQTIGEGVAPQNFPITNAQITQWKNDAAAGGTMGGFSMGNNAATTTGPKKINGSVSFGNGSTLTITGTLWVTGALSFGNTDTVQLDPNTYGNFSGMIIVDGAVSMGNGVSFIGTGQSGSYMMLISMFAGDAISIGNNATSSIFYAPNGEIEVGNGLKVKEATAKRLEVGNNASITYEQGLANANFSSGPSGGWDITNWVEVVP